MQRLPSISTLIQSLNHSIVVEEKNLDDKNTVSTSSGGVCSNNKHGWIVSSRYEFIPPKHTHHSMDPRSKNPNLDELQNVKSHVTTTTTSRTGIHQRKDSKAILCRQSSPHQETYGHHYMCMYSLPVTCQSSTPPSYNMETTTKTPSSYSPQQRSNSLTVTTSTQNVCSNSSSQPFPYIPSTTHHHSPHFELSPNSPTSTTSIPNTLNPFLEKRNLTPSSPLKSSHDEIVPSINVYPNKHVYNNTNQLYNNNHNHHEQSSSTNLSRTESLMSSESHTSTSLDLNCQQTLSSPVSAAGLMDNLTSGAEPIKASSLLGKRKQEDPLSNASPSIASIPTNVLSSQSNSPSSPVLQYSFVNVIPEKAPKKSKKTSSDTNSSKPSPFQFMNFSISNDTSKIKFVKAQHQLRGINDGSWTEKEHEDFVRGLNECGKGKWREIAEKYVKTRTRTQVASHAQKYFANKKF
ncbi:hypothetical protein FDP41_007358 [Naegleria fowleri]|uniref:Uncharacterized protein n=1 Tax=Naegleria fowleri TaxID=5763 RepID=A0A6A5CAC7_NAEFO|nr:uncharacterized protein FDP41_007358 [Naegleria fowleri]KAF0984181.1 hypothetical protein FDP41_007358 [Naegleria fowleri]CAG4715668.1 unnamed protein product [Naegleria fowleri]